MVSQRVNSHDGPSARSLWNQPCNIRGPFTQNLILKVTIRDFINVIIAVPVTTRGNRVPHYLPFHLFYVCVRCRSAAYMARATLRELFIHERKLNSIPILTSV